MSSTEAVSMKTLKDFGYGFNSQGILRQLDPETGDLTDKPFEFEVSESRSENQKNYEALGESLTPYVYDLMEENGLHRVYLPVGQPESKATFIFSSQKELKDVNKLMVIIHGSGVVRAGQWARSVIINHSLDAGTVLPYVKKAQADGYEVIVTNTNDNYRNGKRISGSGSPEEHISTVWKTIVQPADAKSIAVVAHSYGGHLAVDLSANFKDDFNSKVFAVALTDSVHTRHRVSNRVNKIGMNFVSSDKPVGEPEHTSESDMPRVSSGHHKHEMTSHACIEKLFEFLRMRYKEERGEGDEGSPDAKKSKCDEL